METIKFIGELLQIAVALTVLWAFVARLRRRWVTDPRHRVDLALSVETESKIDGSNRATEGAQPVGSG